MNRLINEKSAYLRHAAHQLIDWYPWSDEPFERAQRENKPVFLSSGAVWCHWCHVMAKESFADEEVAELLNSRFVAIKLDRDERPDIDKRYQRAVAALGLGSGWPLSVFLTGERQPFFGGTYFPPEDRHGRTGFKSTLRMIAQLYNEKRDEILAHSRTIMDFLRSGDDIPEDIGPSLIDEGLAAILSGMDRRYGGFGSAPKFPMSGALTFLLNRYFLTENDALGKNLNNTLHAMARGGFYDQLGGGFHRYSTDDAWIVPHFEKMTDDNSWLLRNYTDAYAIFGDPLYEEVAQGIIAFMRQELADSEGGFYASQDADVSPDDEGGYFTWTDEAFKKPLTKEEYEALSLYLYHDQGIMHHDAAKRVLAIARDKDEIAKRTGIDIQRLASLVEKGKAKLLHERSGREKPFVDTAMYTSLNGMAISAFLRAYRTFKDEEVRAFALKSLDRILATRVTGGQVFHCDGVTGLLDDYVHLVDALITAYEVTALPYYRDLARMLMEETLKRFWDQDGGGFLDSEGEVLGIKIKGVEDTPHPSANALAIVLLTRLFYITGKEAFLQQAEEALRAFSRDAQTMGVHAGYWLAALDGYFNGLKLDIRAAVGSDLANAALSLFRPYTTIVYGDDEGRVIPCRRDTCFEPLSGAAALTSFLHEKN